MVRSHYTRFGELSGEIRRFGPRGLHGVISRFRPSRPGRRISLQAVASLSVVIRVELEHVEPRIWRVVRVPADLPLAELHRVVQTLMGWTDRYPHVFQVQRAAPAGRTGAKPSTVTHADVDERLTIAVALNAAHGTLTYLYDIGTEWRVSITRAPGVWRRRTKSPIACLDGYLAGPRDDGGGPAAYNAVLAATLGSGPRLTEAQTRWVGPNFDPERFDRCAVNRALAELQPAV